VADWRTARRCLREIMKDALENGAQEVPLSNVKRLFRSKFQIELSETALGHAKISQLLQDPRFGDICRVELQSRGYAVVPQATAAAAEDEPPSEQVSPSSATTCSVVEDSDQIVTPPRTLRRKKPAPPPLGGDYEWATEGTVGSDMVQRTFIHATPPPPTPMGPSALRRHVSLPPDLKLAQECAGAAWTMFPATPAMSQAPPVMLTEQGVAEPSNAASHGHSRLSPHRSHTFPLDFTSTPVAGDEKLAAFCAAVGCSLPEGLAPAPAPGLEPGQAVFCVNEPLSFEGVEEAAEAPEAQSGDFPARTPSPQWTTPKGGFGPSGARLCPPMSEPCVVSLVALLGAQSPERRAR